MPVSVFYVSCFLAFVAGHILNYSAIFYSLELFESSLIAGVAYGLCFGPPIVFGWVAGAYIDRYSAKRVLLLAQNFFIFGAALMFWVVINPEQKLVWLFLLASGFIGVAWAFVAPSRFAYLFQFAKGHEEVLAKSTVILNLLVMLGFGLAPILLTQIRDAMGWPWVLTIVFVAFVVSSLLIVKGPNQHKRLHHQNLRQEWRDCFQQLFTQPLLIQLLLAAIIGYLMMGPMQVILPQIAEQNLGLTKVQTGNYLGLIAVSLIMGGLLAIALRSRLPIGKAIVILLFVCGFSIGLLGVVEQLWLSCFILVLGTTSAGIVVSFIVASIQSQAVQQLRGRVMSMYTIISQVVSAASGMMAGAIAAFMGPSMSLYVISVLFVTCTLTIWVGAKSMKAFCSLHTG
ncbi:MFS transporter [Bermanella marisrubri]|uniref:Putative transporter n=1 Tax=Bermanella marisrubri TaxID=207949 RepID=Q1N6M7_9GAMM|nr:MFS transporter [Bermanella marisrubri]EAT13565.1 putative transporter [Oceanobacter sp. RED65] [Bermanella marisrubri]QIZ84358.1 MFS transporter [Bermanella marisrubri]